MDSRLWRLWLIPLTIICSLPTLLADEFTNPSNSVNDLTISYTLGQVVQVAWDSGLTKVTLLVSHWGGDAVGALLSDAANPGAFTWTIGQNDNMNDGELQKGSNYVFVLEGVGSCPTSTGWVNCQLQSRAFRVVSNTTTSSTSSSSPTATTSSDSSSTTTTSSTSSSSTSPTSTPSASSSTLSSSITTTTTAAIQSSASAAAASAGLSTGAKTGISVAAAVGGVALIALSVGFTLFCVRRSRTGKEQEHKPAQISELPHPPTKSHAESGQGGYNYAYRQPAESQPPSELATRPYVEPTVHEMGPGSPRQRDSG